MNKTVEIIFGLVGGLAIFIFGMNMMSECLQKAAGDKMKKILSMLTKNPVLGVLAGALTTAVLQSSSATTVMVIGFVSAGLMTLPQAVSISIPAFVANVIFLLKETSVFSAISLMDLMFTAKDLIGLYYKTTESLFLLVVFYLIILLPVSLLGTWLERRVRYAGFGD